MFHTLNIKVLDNCPNYEIVKNYYENKVHQVQYNRDCGIDIIFPSDIILETNLVTKCHMGIACEFYPNGELPSGPFDLVPRSSIINTPLSLANSIGIFDPNYRGEVIAAFRCHVDKNFPSTVDFSSYKISMNDRLVQIIAPDRKPIIVNVVDKLSETDRGTNGFGSTNKKII